jgi:hypothetical protein
MRMYGENLAMTEEKGEAFRFVELYGAESRVTSDIC